MQAKSILISGIGIAGPTLAYWLAARGFEPTLVERAPRPRSGGYVVDFWGVGYDVAEWMGLLPDLRREGYDVEEVRFVDASGRRVGGFGVDVLRRLTNGRYVSLPRGDLAQLVYRQIADRCETMFDDGVTAIKQEGDGVRVEFERAPARRFDLVIGADGLHSEIRRLAFGEEHRFEKYLGYLVAACEVKGYRPRDGRVYVSYAVPGKQVARFAMREERTLFLFVWAAREPPAIGPHDAAAQRAILHAAFGDAGWECPEMLAALDRSEELYFDPVSQIRMELLVEGSRRARRRCGFLPLIARGSRLGARHGRRLCSRRRTRQCAKPAGGGVSALRELVAAIDLRQAKGGRAVRRRLCAADVARPVLAQFGYQGLRGPVRREARAGTKPVGPDRASTLPAVARRPMIIIPTRAPALSGA